MSADPIATFIERWSVSSGSEKANHQSFVKELCAVLGVAHPDPVHEDGDNAYVFEKAVDVPKDDGSVGRGWIDCYKRGCFVLEAKQSSAAGPKRRGTAMHQAHLLKARKQAEGYVRALDPATEPPVPFLMVLDVGGTFDLFVDFTRTNRFWVPFPDAHHNRITLADLAKPDMRARLVAIWNDPYALDPSRKAQAVTRDAAARLAQIALQLERAGHAADRVAGFLMRYFFCAFAEDVGLMKPWQFTEFLRSYRGKATHVQAAMETLWNELNSGGFSQAFRAEVLHFNGGLFSESFALPIDEPQLELLIKTAELDWSPVEPAIFGTLLERALDPRERHRLGAHYTPRAYVDRLVSATVVEPLRDEWQRVQDLVQDLVDDDGPKKSKATALALIADYTGAVKQRAASKKTKAVDDEDRQDIARRLVSAFHARLARVTVLDPACGSGNFLYVALEHLKKLEGEVLALESRLGLGGERIALANLDVDPRNFRGLEINPRAAKIAELVLWIGYLQWYRRSRGVAAGPSGHQWPDPVLKAYHNVECRDALITWTTSEETDDSRWDGFTTKLHPVTGEAVPDPDARVAVRRYENVERATWPEAEFIVGNPPFIGNKRMRLALGDGYVEALRTAWGEVPETADFVMYWWHHAAALVTAANCGRFGFITTNSITQTFNRKIVQAALDKGLVIAWAIPDHPWVDSANGAAVRVAMTVGTPGTPISGLALRVGPAANPEIGGPGGGLLLSVASEEDVEAEVPRVTYREQHGEIHADLTVGADVSSAVELKANKVVCYQGMNLVGEGFRLDNETAKNFGMCSVIKPYQKGKELLQGGDSGKVIDCFGLTDEDVRTLYPAIYQHLLDRVKPERDLNKDKQRRRDWWLHGRSNENLREAIAGLNRYIITVETSKFKPFVFADSTVIPDHKLYAITSDDAWVLGVLSSRLHLTWALAAGGHLGVGNDPTWTNGTCFLPFPFPAATAVQQQRIRELGEELDAHRKRQQAAHPDLTLTGMYNVLAKLKQHAQGSGQPLNAKEKIIHEHGLCAVLLDLHQRLDAAVADAYGWPATLSDDDILTRLVALNAERAREEATGTIRWLRPDYQRAVVKTTVKTTAKKRT